MNCSRVANGGCRVAAAKVGLLAALLLTWGPLLHAQEPAAASAGETTIVDARIGSAPSSDIDPYEGWNRRVYGFNEFVDDWVLRPVAQGYRTVVPSPVDNSVTNFFSNIGEIGNFANSVFQLKGESAVVALGRFTYNTIFGLGGLFDVADAFGLPERQEDFGQTLGYWGVGNGPYLMLPLLGPSTVRDFGGLAVDYVTIPGLDELVDEPEYYYLVALNVVDLRADLIPAERFMSGDGYTFVRNAYLQRREYLVNDGKSQRDPFAADDDEDLMLEDF